MIPGASGTEKCESMLPQNVKNKIKMLHHWGWADNSWVDIYLQIITVTQPIKWIAVSMEIPKGKWHVTPKPWKRHLHYLAALIRNTWFVVFSTGWIYSSCKIWIWHHGNEVVPFFIFYPLCISWWDFRGGLRGCRQQWVKWPQCGNAGETLREQTIEVSHLLAQKRD